MRDYAYTMNNIIWCVVKTAEKGNFYEYGKAEESSYRPFL